MQVTIFLTITNPTCLPRKSESRCVLVLLSKPGSYVIVCLAVCHWFSLVVFGFSLFNSTILCCCLQKNGGWVYAIDYGDDLPSPARVWLKEAQLPGLAMSRSVGDTVGKAAGVISTPEITTHTINDADRFVDQCLHVLLWNHHVDRMCDALSPGVPLPRMTSCALYCLYVAGTS